MAFCMAESGQGASYKENGDSPSRGRATDSGIISARHKCRIEPWMPPQELRLL